MERLVEAELGAEPRQVLPGGLGAEHHLGGIARREMEDDEDDERHPEQHGPEVQEPAQEVGAHDGAAI